MVKPKVKKPVKKPVKKAKPKSTMSQSVRQTVIVNQPVAPRKRKRAYKSKPKADSNIITSLIDKFVNLQAEQAKINNTITQAKQSVKVDTPVTLSTPVSKISGLNDMEVKKIKKTQEPFELSKPTGIEKIKKAMSLLETNGNILNHLSKKKPPSAPTLSDTIDSLFDEKPVKSNPLRTQRDEDIDDLMAREEDGYVIF